MHIQLRKAIGCAAIVWIAAASVAQQAAAAPGLTESAVLPPTPAAVFAGRRAQLAAQLDAPGAVVVVESGARPHGGHRPAPSPPALGPRRPRSRALR